jgi:uncharacterized protein (DUF2164 family)
MKIEKFHLSKETKQEMIDQIKAYFQDERDEEIGDLGASIILDFIIEKLAPEFYNQGVLDSHAFLQDHLSDVLEIQK